VAIVMGPNSYGKAEVRLVKVIRDGARHDVADLTVTVTLQGDFDDVYVAGDNREVLPTDTIMRTVYALAADDPLQSIEGFGRRLVAHFLEATPAAGRAQVRLLQHPWGRITVKGEEHAHSFVRAAGGQRTATVTGGQDGTQVQAGIADLLVLKTTDSAFRGYLKDDYTLLEETDDRILSTVVTADWTYSTPDVDFNAQWEGVRQTVLETFAERYSESVQHTLWMMGQAVLEEFDRIERISFSLPNKHHLLVDLEPYGRRNDRVVFHATDRPYGLIEGTVERSSR
jgi:urate oxidase